MFDKRENWNPVTTNSDGTICHAELIEQPFRWKKPRLVSIDCDIFHPDVPERFVADVFGVMAAAHQHTFEVLTKHPQRARYLLGVGCMGCFENDVEDTLAMYSERPLVWPLPNVRLGVPVEDQEAANNLIPMLILSKATYRFVRVVPMNCEIDLRLFFPPMSGVGWVSPHRLVGYKGELLLHRVECGGTDNPVHPDWVRSLRDQCKAAGASFIFKHWGEWVETECQPGGDLGDDMRRGIVTIVKPSGENDGHFRRGDVLMRKVGNKSAGRLLDGVLHDEFSHAA